MTGTRTLLAAGAIGSVISLLAGCAPSDAGAGDTDLSDILATETVQGVPEGAMLMSEDVYAVPIGVDSEGCEQFSEWSARGVVRPIVYYRDGDGGFTAVKSEDHSCNADMVESGEDDQGCMMYRAEQPDGEAADVVYYRVDGGYTARRDGGACKS